MRPGLFPSQQRALRRTFKKADAFDNFRQRTRRAFVGLGLLAVATGVGGFALGRWWNSDATPEREVVRDRWRAKLSWAQTYAEQPIAILSANYATFLMVIEQTGGDERTWRGFEKLLNHSLSAAADSDAHLKQMLLRTAKIAPPPEWLHVPVQRLAKARD